MLKESLFAQVKTRLIARLYSLSSQQFQLRLMDKLNYKHNLQNVFRYISVYHGSSPTVLKMDFDEERLVADHALWWRRKRYCITTFFRRSSHSFIGVYLDLWLDNGGLSENFLNNH